MNPANLVLRCYAEEKSGHWQAFCIDLNLAVQGESCQSVQVKLQAQICEYVTDALVGEDKAFADQLLSRKAPLFILAKYYVALLQNRFHYHRFVAMKVFTELMPLLPARSCR